MIKTNVKLPSFSLRTGKFDVIDASGIAGVGRGIELDDHLHRWDLITAAGMTLQESCCSWLGCVHLRIQQARVTGPSHWNGIPPVYGLTELKLRSGLLREMRQSPAGSPRIVIAGVGTNPVNGMPCRCSWPDSQQRKMSCLSGSGRPASRQTDSD